MYSSDEKIVFLLNAQYFSTFISIFSQKHYFIFMLSKKNIYTAWSNLEIVL